MQHNKDPADPSRLDRLCLAKKLEVKFDFTTMQSRYLAVNAYGFCCDIIDQIEHIDISISYLKNVLEDLKI